MYTTTVIDNAVDQYHRRQTRQTVKRLLRVADRLNGDRLAKVTGASIALRKTLDELHTVAPNKAKQFAISIGWGDRLTA